MTRGFLRSRCAAALLVAASGLTLAPDADAAELNGFLRRQGHGDVAFSFTSESYDEFWVGDMRVADPGVGEVDTRSLSVWFAYGITDDLSIIADLPFIDTESDGLGGFEERDLQDLTLMLAYRLGSLGENVQSNFVGALGARTDVVRYEANSPVDVGDGTDDWLFRFVYQLRYRGFYASQQIGFDLRGADAPDGIPLHTEVGQTWGPVTASGFYSRYFANGGTDIGDPGFTFPSNGDEFARAGAKVYGRVNDHIGLSGLWFTTITGRNTGDVSGVSGGIVYSF